MTNDPNNNWEYKERNSSLGFWVKIGIGVIAVIILVMWLGAPDP